MNHVVDAMVRLAVKGQELAVLVAMFFVLYVAGLVSVVGINWTFTGVPPWSGEPWARFAGPVAVSSVVIVVLLVVLKLSAGGVGA